MTYTVYIGTFLLVVIEKKQPILFWYNKYIRFNNLIEI